MVAYERKLAELAGAGDELGLHPHDSRRSGRFGALRRSGRCRGAGRRSRHGLGNPFPRPASGAVEAAWVSRAARRGYSKTASPVERFRYCYQSDLATPMAARRDALAAARAWGIENLSDRLALLITELVTNAVRHAGRRIEMELRWDPPALRAAVSDRSAQPPVLSDRPPGEGGLGLRIIDQLADSWGVDPGPNGGKAVWFLLDVAVS